MFPISLCLPLLLDILLLLSVSDQAERLIPPDPPTYEDKMSDDLYSQPMKLADAPEDARERLRASNLDDLENAFKDESPLGESYSFEETNIDDHYPFHQEKKPLVPAPQSQPFRQSQIHEDDESLESFGVETKEEDIDLRQNQNIAEQAFPPKPSFNKRVSFQDEDPFETFQPRRSSYTDEPREMEYEPPSQNKNPSRSIIVINGAELETPQRKTCLATIILIIASIGIGLAMTRPLEHPALSTSSTVTDPCDTTSVGRSTVFNEINTTIKCNVPTVSPAPTVSHPPTLTSNQPTKGDVSPTIFDLVYKVVREFIVDSQVSTSSSLPVKCNHALCADGENEETLTIQQRTINYLLTSDQIFMQWVNQNKINEHSEKVIQRYILTLMAMSLNSDDWLTRTNWPAENGSPSSKDECQWFGITCGDRSAYIHLNDFIDHTFLSKTGDISGREVEAIPMVIGVNLRNNTMVGELPREVFKLRHLEEFKIHHNEASGSLPKSIGLLSNMRKLWLYDNDMSGSIPTTIANMTKLTSLWLGLNKFGDTIPTQIGLLSNLETLALHGNALIGSIPEEIVKLTNLKNLYLDMNKLNGTIPEQIGKLIQLRDLRINTNNLQGGLPFSMSELKFLETFYGYKNNLGGGLGNNLVVGWESLG